jgi:hypothetical protein
MMLKKISSALVLMCFIKFAYAQQDSTKNTLTLATLYNSNISYYGQVTSEKYPYILANATYRFAFGLSLSAGAYKLLNYNDVLSETDLGIGYDHDFTEKLNIGVAYTRSFFPNNSPLLQSSNQNNLNASVTYDWDFVKVALNTDFAFGKQKDFFLGFNASKEIFIANPFSDKNTLSTEPALEIIAGTTHYYESYIIQKNKNNGKGQGNGNANGKGNDNNIPTTTVETLSTDFKMLSYNFKLPLTFSRANYLAEANYQFSILGDNEVDKKTQSFFGLAFYYQF